MSVFLRGGRHVPSKHIPKTGGTSTERVLRGNSRTQMWLYSTGLHQAEFEFPSSPQDFRSAVLEELFDPSIFDLHLCVVRHSVGQRLSEYGPKYRRSLKLAASITPFDEWAEEVMDQFESKPNIRDNRLRPMVDFVGQGTVVFKFQEGLESPVTEAAIA